MLAPRSNKNFVREAKIGNNDVRGSIPKLWPCAPIDYFDGGECIIDFFKQGILISQISDHDATASDVLHLRQPDWKSLQLLLH